MKRIISVCGLDCSKCKIYLAPSNPKIAQKLVKIFDKIWENISPNDFHCSTCRGDISGCWTKECWIRDCCLNDKELEYCYQCQEFPCVGLKKRANKNKRYKKALKTFEGIQNRNIE